MSGSNERCQVSLIHFINSITPLDLGQYLCTRLFHHGSFHFIGAVDDYKFLQLIKTQQLNGNAFWVVRVAGAELNFNFPSSSMNPHRLSKNIQKMSYGDGASTAQIPEW